MVQLSTQLFLFPLLVVGLESYIRQDKPYPFPAELLHAMNRLALYMGTDYPSSVQSFFRLMEKPLSDWWPDEPIPDVFDKRLSLMAEGQLTELAELYLSEENISGLKVSELISWQENQLMREFWLSMRTKYQNTQANEDAARIEGEYTQVRKFLIGNAFTYAWEIRRQVPNEYWNMVQEMYMPATDQHMRDGECVECPECGAVPVNWYGQRQGIKPGLCATRCPGRSGWREVQHDADLLVLKIGLQRRTLIPGRVELALFEWLQSQMPSDALILYPGVDQYDIQIRFSDGEVWAVDVKDFGDPIALGKQIAHDPQFASPAWDDRLAWTRAFYVVPNQCEIVRPGYCDQVRSEAVSTAQVVTIGQFQKAVSNKLWELE